MTAQELKAKLTEQDIVTLLEIMGACISEDNDKSIVSTTVCHNGTSQKLYYYKDTQYFQCYSECGSMDILSVVMGNKGYEDYELYRAINWICTTLNIDTMEYGFGGQPQIISDWEFINDYKRSKKKTENREVEELIEYDSSVFNIFQKVYTTSWINDGMTTKSMEKYGIQYCMWQQQVIIPHYDIIGRLIGIRGRNMLADNVEQYGKYIPFRLFNRDYAHSLGRNLYGLNHNIRAIKRKRKMMLVEGEKSVIQADSMFGEDNFTVAMCGKHLTSHQRDMIIMMDIDEVIIAVDKQFENADSDEAIKWSDHIKKNFVRPLSPYMKVSILWDGLGLLRYKDSPTDRGKEVLLKLLDNKIYAV